MSWTNKLKGLFIVPVEDPAAPKPKNEPPKAEAKPAEKPLDRPQSVFGGGASTPVGGTTSPLGGGSEGPQKVAGAAGAFNQKIFDSLVKAIEAANLPGEDYLEYVQAYNAMANIPLDDKVKVQTVLATLSTKGLTLQKVLESADYYAQILQNEKDKFNSALNSQTDGQVNSKREGMKKLERQIVEKEQAIKTLQVEIEECRAQIHGLNQEIVEAEGKIAQTVGSFNTTYDAVLGQIKSNLQKIKAVSA